MHLDIAIGVFFPQLITQLFCDIRISFITIVYGNQTVVRCHDLLHQQCARFLSRVTIDGHLPVFQAYDAALLDVQPIKIRIAYRVSDHAGAHLLRSLVHARGIVLRAVLRLEGHHGGNAHGYVLGWKNNDLRLA